MNEFKFCLNQRFHYFLLIMIEPKLILLTWLLLNTRLWRPLSKMKSIGKNKIAEIYQSVLLLFKLLYFHPFFSVFQEPDIINTKPISEWNMGTESIY